MNMGLSFFRKFEATSSLMRGNLGRRSETNRYNFPPRANASLGMGAPRSEKCRRRNDLCLARETQLPGRTFTIGKNKSCRFAGRAPQQTEPFHEIHPRHEPSGVMP
jgi:hypothetical protein